MENMLVTIDESTNLAGSEVKNPCRREANDIFCQSLQVLGDSIL